MKTYSFTSPLFSLALWSAQFVSAEPLSVQRRDASILIDPAAQPSLPSIGAATAAASTVGLNLTNIQGDVLIGMKKNKELFFFFGITDGAKFKSSLKSVILPRVTTTTQLLDVSKQPNTALNIAFSQTGLKALNITDNLGDSAFSQGQFANAANLGDPGTTNWVKQFIGTSIHGVLLLASDTLDKCESELTAIKNQLAKCNCVKELYRLEGAARPGSEQGHEHFGFLDGISNPAVEGFQTPLPGQAVVPPGEILVGESGDSLQASRPSWAKDGSFLAFRQLKQLVPEFNKFLADNPIRTGKLTRQQGSDLMGARMVGRWKSGAPVFLSPLVDDPNLGADPHRNNNFTYAKPGQTFSDPADQTKCAFAAHIRKTRPRADLGLPENQQSSNHHIVRGGIPYGPEVSAAEAKANKTQTERGLAFVAYQSNILAGFQFLQRFWADNIDFVQGNVGFDPIIGANAGSPRIVNGLDPTNATRSVTIETDFIVSRGGEYFFSPSLTALATKFAA
ncbi:Fungal peroxidase [Mycena indigotica]|uniref:Fungal peroxidase n=1 Tax=Mycena indigotica TaxID=2126181 RepID=A0A8H6VVQ3_9AGAR|nr:Fungal peroxidase [Mycena indigotica]KAF7291858.1 Fungal peroxidase [Mycena indigotica]